MTRAGAAALLTWLSAFAGACAPTSSETGGADAGKLSHVSPGITGESARAETRSSELSLVEKLEARGLNPTRKGSIRQPFLSVPGTVYDVSGSDLQIFTYPNRAELMRDVAKLDTATVSPPTMMISWIAPPTLITNGTVAAIFLTRDDSLRKVVRAAAGKRD